MKGLSQSIIAFDLGMLVMVSPVVASDQDAASPVAAPACMIGVEIEPLGQGMPPNAGGRALIVARLTIAPDGGCDVHTHPGMLTVTVDAGQLTFTQIDMGR